MKYEYLGDKEDLVLIGLGDASYKQDGKAIGGVIIVLANFSLTLLNSWLDDFEHHFVTFILNTCMNKQTKSYLNSIQFLR